MTNVHLQGPTSDETCTGMESAAGFLLQLCADVPEGSFQVPVLLGPDAAQRRISTRATTFNRSPSPPLPHHAHRPPIPLRPWLALCTRSVSWSRLRRNMSCTSPFALVAPAGVTHHP